MIVWYAIETSGAAKEENPLVVGNRNLYGKFLKLEVGAMRKTKVFNSFEEYENWTEKFDNCSDYEMIPTIIDDGWKIAADLFTECKTYRTALKRFKKAFSDWKIIEEWTDCIFESCENGIFTDTTGWKIWNIPDEEVRKGGVYSFGVEENMEGLWYIYLNISGCYAGREEK